MNPSVFQRVCVKSGDSRNFYFFFIFCKDPQLQFHLDSNKTENSWLVEHKPAAYFFVPSVTKRKASQSTRCPHDIITTRWPSPVDLHYTSNSGYVECTRSDSFCPSCSSLFFYFRKARHSRLFFFFFSFSVTETTTSGLNAGCHRQAG